MTGRRQGLLQQGVLLSLVAIIASVIAFGKEAVFARTFGVSYVADAYTMAIQIPEILFAVVWETISATIIPLYTDKLHNAGKASAQKFFSTILTLIGTMSLCVIAFGEIVPEFFLSILFPGVPEQTRLLAADLLRWVLPMLFFEGIIRVLTGVLNVHGQFALPRILCSVRNIGGVVFLVLFAKQFGIYAAVWGVLTGIAIESMLCLVVTHKYERCVPSLSLKDPALKTLVKMAIPLLFGIGMREVNQIVNKVVASYFDAGSISSLNYATKLSSMIETMLLGNIALLLYPRYAVLAAQDKKEPLGFEYLKTINICLLIGVPVVLGGVFLREEMVSIAFAGGSFDREAVLIVSALFAIYLVSAVFTAISGATVKLFTACCDTKTPTISAAIGVIVNIVLSIVFAVCWGVNGLALATLASSIVTCILQIGLARKKIYKFRLRMVGRCAIQAIVSGTLMCIGLVVFKIVFLNHWTLDSLMCKIVFCVLAVFIGVCIYAVASLLMKTEEVIYLFQIVMNKRRRRAND